MELDVSGVVANLLYRALDRDELAVHIVAELLESFSNLDIVDRTENSAGRAGLCADSERYALESCSGSLGVFQNLSELVGALLLVLGELLEGRGRGNDSLTLGDEIVAAVTRLLPLPHRPCSRD